MHLPHLSPFLNLSKAPRLTARHHAQKIKHVRHQNRCLPLRQFTSGQEQSESTIISNARPSQTSQLKVSAIKRWKPLHFVVQLQAATH